LVSQTWRRIIDPKKYVSPVCVWRIINDYKTSPDDDGIPSSLNFGKHTHRHTHTADTKEHDTLLIFHHVAITNIHNHRVSLPFSFLKSQIIIRRKFW
jgi:hypothetical protein